MVVRGKLRAAVLEATVRAFFVTAFVGMALSIATTVVIIFVRRRLKPPKIVPVAATAMLFVSFGGMLVFELPMWIVATALTLGVSTAVFAQWDSKDTD
jgi:hypothetical protein